MSARADTVKVKHILLQHRDKVMSEGSEEFQRIIVRRSHLFSDALRTFSRSSFDPTKYLKVTFVGEPAVDEEGPRRELFCLIQSASCTSGLFAGLPGHLTPIHSVEALSSNKFYVLGKMLATGLVQGGQPPVCFAKPVADFLVYESVKSAVDLDDIPEYDIIESLKKVQAASSAEELKSLMHEDEFDFRFRCGYNKPTSHMDLSDRDEFIRAVWLHYVLFQPYAELQQLRNGLKDTLQLELLLTLYPEEMWNPFATTNAYDVTVDYLLDSFTIQYSDQGSNKRSLEESIVYMWSQYITECEGSSQTSLPDVLQFLTGANKLPATGFDKTPMIQFTDESSFPVASSCALSITFSRAWGSLQYDAFVEKMNYAVLNSWGFGSV